MTPDYSINPFDTQLGCRTSKAQSVRDQVVVDMREGRKWKVQVALLSQSLEDFDAVMVEFATSIFIMDAGPQQAIDKSAI